MPKVSRDPTVIAIVRRLVDVADAIKAFAVEIGVCDLDRMQHEYTVSEKQENARAKKPTP